MTSLLGSLWWPLQWLVIYIIGGVTFVPLVLLLGIGYVVVYGSETIGDQDPVAYLGSLLSKPPLVPEAKAEVDGSTKTPTAVQVSKMSGWITIRKTFKSAQSGGVGAFFTGKGNNDPITAHTSKDAETKDKDSKLAPSNGSPATSSVSSRLYRISQYKNSSAPKENYFAMLKGSVLYLYEDETQADCAFVIALDQYTATIVGSDGLYFEGKDAEMFGKRNGLVLRYADQGKEVEKKGMAVLSKGMDGDGNKEEEEKTPWYIFVKPNTKLEDWYIALVQASSVAPTTDKVFASRDMQSLVDVIDTEPDPIPMRWFNAGLGRMLMGICKTQALEDAIKSKIHKKIAKMPKSALLGPIIVREVNSGTTTPIFSKPMLKSLTAEGACAFNINVGYHSRPDRPESAFNIIIATNALIPMGFNRNFNVEGVLEVRVKSIEGTLLVQIKDAPSNRVWWGFTSPPKLDFEVRPIISTRALNINFLLTAVEKQIKDAMADAIVLPNMDDFAFFDTSALVTRGGIFSEAGKNAEPDTPPDVAESAPSIGSETTAAKEDPTSAVAETPGIRKRAVNKFKSVDMSGAVPPGDALDTDLTRTESAPTASNSSAQPSTIKGNGGSQVRSNSLSSRTRDSLADSLADALNNQPTKPDAVKKADSAESASRSDSPDMGKVTGIHTLGAKRRVSDSHGDSSGAAETSGANVPSRPSSAASSTLNPPVAASSSSAAPTVDDTDDTAPPTTIRAVAGNINNLWQKGDKKAASDQLKNFAADRFKSFGVGGFGLKNRLAAATQAPPAATKAAPLYRPADEDADATGPRISTDVHRPVSERLSAVASSSTTSPVSIPGRERSASNGSQTRNSAIKTASHLSNLSASNSPPHWPPVTGAKPTTDTNNAEASGTTSPNLDASSSRSGSFSTVSMQPSKGMSMKVPRVIKRPGEVTGMGHDPALGMVRRVSEGEKGSQGVVQPSERNLNVNVTATDSLQTSGDKVEEISSPVQSSTSGSLDRGSDDHITGADNVIAGNSSSPASEATEAAALAPTEPVAPISISDVNSPGPDMEINPSTSATDIDNPSGDEAVHVSQPSSGESTPAEEALRR